MKYINPVIFLLLFSITSALGTANKLRVAMVQPVPEVNAAKSLELGIAYCRQAKTGGADIVLFPEMFSLGYYTNVDFTNEKDVADWKALAQSTDGPYVTRFQNLARELDLAIVITYLEKIGDKLRNAATLFDRHGKWLYTYHKVHTCTFFPWKDHWPRVTTFM